MQDNTNISMNDNKAKVLIIDDDEGLVHIISKSLRRLAYEVSHARSGLEAIERVTFNKNLLLLLDQNLPDMTGQEIIRRLRHLKIEVPFIMMTGRGDEKLAVEIMKLGAADYLVKDSDFLDSLPRVIEKVYKSIEIENKLKNTELALQVSEHKYRKIFENIQDILYQTDIEGTVIEISPSVKKLGYTREELIGKPALDLYLDPKDREKLIVTLLSKGRVTDYELRLKSKDGREVIAAASSHMIYSSDGKAIGTEGVLRDISQRIKAETALRDSEQRYNTFINSTTDLIFLKDDQFRYIVVNKAYSDFIGMNQESIYGKTDYEIFINETAFGCRNSDIQTVEKCQVSSFEEILKGKVFEINKFPVRLQDGKVGVGAFIRNITDRKIIEQELIEAKEKAEESDKLKTAFLQNMSHEIRTPLNAITGFAQLLATHSLTDEARTNYSEIILKSSHMLLEIVSDVLAISTLDAGQDKVYQNKIELGKMMVEFQEEYQSMALKKNLNLVFSNYNALENFQIFADKAKLKVILSKLLSNAIKFSHKGTIKFGCTVNEEVKEVKFFVSDEGIGIQKDHQQKIFDKFVQADPKIATNYGGTGLGLSICKGYVEKIGGKIWVDSELENGSTFYFTIPYLPASNSTNANTPIMQKNVYEQISKATTILIAEDQEFNFIYLNEILSSKGYNILHAKNGEEAVKICRDTENIDIILMDIKMPIMDGYSATKIIKEFRPNIPIIAQTAYAAEKEVAEYINIFNDYITKPITSNKLLQVIRSLIK